MYKLYIFKHSERTIANLIYTETFDTEEEAEIRVSQFEADNYVITRNGAELELPLR